jgi:hypothetical protein
VCFWLPACYLGCVFVRADALVCVCVCGPLALRASVIHWSDPHICRAVWVAALAAVDAHALSSFSSGLAG